MGLLFFHHRNPPSGVGGTARTEPLLLETRKGNPEKPNQSRRGALERPSPRTGFVTAKMSEHWREPCSHSHVETRHRDPRGESPTSLLRMGWLAGGYPLLPFSPPHPEPPPAAATHAHSAVPSHIQNRESAKQETEEGGVASPPTGTSPTAQTAGLGVRRAVRASPRPPWSPQNGRTHARRQWHVWGPGSTPSRAASGSVGPVQSSEGADTTDGWGGTRCDQRRLVLRGLSGVASRYLPNCPSNLGHCRVEASATQKAAREGSCVKAGPPLAGWAQQEEIRQKRGDLRTSSAADTPAQDTEAVSGPQGRHRAPLGAGVSELTRTATATGYKDRWVGPGRSFKDPGGTVL